MKDAAWKRGDRSIEFDSNWWSENCRLSMMSDRVDFMRRRISWKKRNDRAWTVKLGSFGRERWCVAGEWPPLFFPLRYSFVEHKSGRKARVSRSRNGVELSCIKISILDWFSDIRAWIYDIILRALKLEQLGMSLRTILACHFIENIAESQFWFSFWYSIPIGHRERSASL